MLNWAANILQRGSEQVERLAQASQATDLPVALTVSESDFERATHSALSAASMTAQSVNMIAVSIDFFDVIAASHGATVAEEVITTAANRITKALRSSDALARLGDDGFAVLWAPSRLSPVVEEVANRIASQFHEPIVTTTGQLAITASIGITSVTGRAALAVNAQTLQRQAKTAVLSAQRNGRSQLAFFDETIQARALETYETERQLRAVLNDQKLRDQNLGIEYQPIVSLHSGTVVGVEALARWNDHSLGSVSPTTFIPIAETSGLIGQLGRLILQNAIKQGSFWNKNGQADSLLAVNLSNHQLLDPELIPAIEHLLDEHDLAPQQLCVELSESVVMSDVAASMTILGHMKDLGLCLAVDDFGTGYSSLSYLRRLPVDILKIDQSFVQSLYNRDDRVITKAIIDLAHTLGMTTIAEGVETHLQVEVLHALNCDMAQGFFLQAPAPADLVDFSNVDFSTVDFSPYTESNNMPRPSGSRDLSWPRAAAIAPYVPQ